MINNQSKSACLIYSITFDNGEAVEVWDGKSKGPPRKEKFPDKDEILDKIKAESS